jgi:low temperature requirement protein LtrA
MGILTVLAVFTGNAASTDGEQFALIYAALLAVLVWQWASVYRTDAPEYRPGARRYLAGLVVSIGALLASSGMEDSGRVAIWAAVVVGSIALVVVYMLRSSDESLGIRATDSMAERYGLFIIIVLGEVVVGWQTGCGGSRTSTSARSRRAFSGSVSPSASGGPTSTSSASDCRGGTRARSCCGSTSNSRSRSRSRPPAPAW